MPRYKLETLDCYTHIFEDKSQRIIISVPNGSEAAVVLDLTIKILNEMDRRIQELESRIGYGAEED